MLFLLLIIVHFKFIYNKLENNKITQIKVLICI